MGVDDQDLDLAGLLFGNYTQDNTWESSVLSQNELEMISRANLLRDFDLGLDIRKELTESQSSSQGILLPPKPSRSAQQVDYSEIQETADEIVDKQDFFAKRALSRPSASMKKPLDDDDEDYDAEEPSSSNQPPSLTFSSLVPPLPLPPTHIQPVVEETPVPIPQQPILQLDMNDPYINVDPLSFPSTKCSDGTMIIKFSELFLSQGSVSTGKVKGRVRSYNRYKDEIRSQDEESMFLNQAVSATQTNHTQKQQRISVKGSVSGFNFPAVDTKALLERGEAIIGEYSAVDHVPWESNIIWDTEESNQDFVEEREQLSDVEDEPSTTALESKKPARESTLATDSDPRHWGSLQLDTESADIPIPESNPKAATKAKENRRQAFALQAALKEYQTYNQDLDLGDWESQIIWSDEQANSLCKVPILYDCNDKTLALFLEVVPNEDDVEILPRKLKPEPPAPKPEVKIESKPEPPKEVAKYIKQARQKPIHPKVARKLVNVKPMLCYHDLKCFHKPQLLLQDVTDVRIIGLASQKFEKMLKTDRAHTSELFRTPYDLSCRDGDFLLFEYMDELPCLISNFGMCSLIYNYYRKQSASDEHKPVDFPEGQPAILDPGEDSPFIGPIFDGETIQCLENNMFKSPIVRHDPQQGTFLLIRRRDTNQFHIRNIPGIYVCGRTEALLQVPVPNVKDEDKYMRDRIKLFVYRSLQAPKKQIDSSRIKVSITIEEIQQHFPALSTHYIRRRLREYCECSKQDDHGWSIMKDLKVQDDDTLTGWISPEQVCLFESLFYGTFRLQLAPEDLEVDKLQLPWRVTERIIKDRKGQLPIEGAPKPLSNKTIQMLSKNSTVTGTNADLRKVTFEEAKKILSTLGYTEESIKPLDRWECIDIIRKKSIEALAAGEESEITKFARGTRLSQSQHYLDYKEKIQQEFRQRYLNLHKKQLDTDEDSDSSLDSDLEDFARSMTSSTKKHSEGPNRDQEDRQMFDPLRSPAVKTPFSPTTPFADSNVPNTPNLAATLNATPANTNQPPPTDQPVSFRNKVLKKITRTFHADGTVTWREDVIRDRRLVDIYIMTQQLYAGYTRAETGYAAPQAQEQAKKQPPKPVRKPKPKPKSSGDAAPAAVVVPARHVKKTPSKPQLSVDTKPIVGSSSSGLVLRIQNPGKLVMQSPAATNTEKANRKKRESTEDDDDYSIPAQKVQRRARSETNYLVMFRNTFERIMREALKQLRSNVIPFMQPVRDIEAPGYHQIITTPMDIGTIKTKITKEVYRSRAQFMDDVELIVANCYSYNESRNPHLLPLADSILDTFTHLVDQESEKLAEYEKGLEKLVQDSQRKADRGGNRAPHNHKSDSSSEATQD